MTIFGYEIRRRGPARVVTLRGKEMTEKEINEALMVPETLPLYRAFMQLLATATENAQYLAGDEAHNPTLMAGYVGAVRQFLLLRDEIHNRRATASEELKPASRIKHQTIGSDEA